MAQNFQPKVAKAFWKNLKSYPEFGSKQRRLYEMMYLVPALESCDKLIDVGCGDATQLHLLSIFTDIESYVGLDISEHLIAGVASKYPFITTHLYDIGKSQLKLEGNVALYSGCLQYVFDETAIQKSFIDINTKAIIVRATCSESHLEINKYSGDLNANYSCIYRTVDEMKEILSKQFEIIDIQRVYPNELESKYGTKQYWFKGIRK